MKTYKDLYQKLTEPEVITTAVHKALIGKKKKKRIRKYAKNEDRAILKAPEWIKNFKTFHHTPIYINDGISKKRRKIIVPTFQELVVQHCVVQVLQPLFYTGMYEHSYASVPGRGGHKGKKFIEKWIKHHPKHCKYVLKMDIRHFFDSIPHDILKAKLEAKIKDDQMLDLLYKIIDVTDVGLPIGFYTSQWLSNWYLMGLDHYIKEQLGAVYYMRYMDDMVIFGSNKRKLHEMRKAISDYLNNELGLELKSNYQVFRFIYTKNEKDYGRFLDFMGFRFYRNRTTMRRSIMLRATRKAKKMSKKQKVTIYDIRQIMAYLGWLNATDTYNMFLKYIKPYVNFQKCRRRISKYDRRLQQQSNLNSQTKGVI